MTDMQKRTNKDTGIKEIKLEGSDFWEVDHNE